MNRGNPSYLKVVVRLALLANALLFFNPICGASPNPSKPPSIVHAPPVLDWTSLDLWLKGSVWAVLCLNGIALCLYLAAFFAKHLKEFKTYWIGKIKDWKEKRAKKAADVKDEAEAKTENAFATPSASTDPSAFTQDTQTVVLDESVAAPTSTSEATAEASIAEPSIAASPEASSPPSADASATPATASEPAIAEVPAPTPEAFSNPVGESAPSEPPARNPFDDEKTEVIDTQAEVNEATEVEAPAVRPEPVTELPTSADILNAIEEVENSESGENNLATQAAPTSSVSAPPKEAPAKVMEPTPPTPPSPAPAPAPPADTPAATPSPAPAPQASSSPPPPLPPAPPSAPAAATSEAAPKKKKTTTTPKSKPEKAEEPASQTEESLPQVEFAPATIKPRDPLAELPELPPPPPLDLPAETPPSSENETEVIVSFEENVKDGLTPPVNAEATVQKVATEVPTPSPTPTSVPTPMPKPEPLVQSPQPPPAARAPNAIPLEAIPYEETSPSVFNEPTELAKETPLPDPDQLVKDILNQVPSLEDNEATDLIPRLEELMDETKSEPAETKTPAPTLKKLKDDDESSIFDPENLDALLDSELGLDSSSGEETPPLAKKT